MARLNLLEHRRVHPGHAQDGHVVKIVGTVQAPERPVVVPHSGRECVFYDVTVQKRFSSNYSEPWVTVLRERDVIPFQVLAEGVLVSIEVSDLHVAVVRDVERTGGWLLGRRPIVEVLRRYGMPVPDEPLRLLEGTIDVGERVSVLGRARWTKSASASRSASYRASPRTLTLSAADDAPLPQRRPRYLRVAPRR